MKEEDADDRRGIQSVEIGLRVLDVLRQHGSAMSLKQIAADSGISASNCHRYLVSLARAGFVEQHAATGRYNFGAAAVRTGLAALERLDAVAIGTDALLDIVEETGNTGLLALWSGDDAVIVRWMPGRKAVRTTLAAGAHLPLLTSATGRVFLAYLDKRRTAEALAKLPKQRAQLVDTLADGVRAIGMATADGDHIPGLSAAAVPILDAHGDAAAAITLVGLADGFAPAALVKLKSAATAASERLGWSAR